MSKSKTMSRWAARVRTRIANVLAGRRKRSAVIQIVDGYVKQGRKFREYVDRAVRDTLGIEGSGTIRISRAREGAFSAGADTSGFGRPNRYVNLYHGRTYLDFICTRGFRKFTGMSIRPGDRFDVVTLETDIEPVAPAPALFIAPLVEA